MKKMGDKGQMKKKEKVYSIALASTFLILFLLFISTAASASPEQNQRTIAPPEISSGAGDPSDDQILSDELSTEESDTANESIQPAAALKITETRITTSKSEQSNPIVYGDRIAWTDYGNEKSDVYVYDLSTKKQTQITNNGNSSCFAMYGNNILWEDWSNSEYGSIYMQDLSTKKKTLITTFTDAFDSASFYGDKIVFTTWGVLLMYDLSTKKETQIPTNVNAAYSDIYGNKIVYCSNLPDENDNTNIYMYDLSTKKETQITTKASGCSPAIYGNKIVWQDARNGNADIYMYDIFTKKEKRITTNPSDSYSPKIYGDRIVWEDDRNGNWDIYVYDLTTRQESHTTDKSDQYNLDIYGNRIVWTDMRNGNADIYMGTLSTSPVAAFSASPTSGNAPLKVKFTDKSTGSPTSWKWSFGDGKTSTSKNPSYTYSKAGKYTVSLTVKNAAGSNTKTIKNYIVVNALKAPVAAFSASPRSGKAPLKVQFTDKSANSPTSWKWSFGDGTYSTAKSPAHKYSKAGKYTVSLTVKNAKGSNTKTISGYITVSKR